MEAREGYIQFSEDIRFGKPHIAGRRITVADIVLRYNRLAMSPEEIALDYDLPLAAVYAALAYYYDHREEIEQSIAKNDETLETLARQHPSLLEESLRKLAGA